MPASCTEAPTHIETRPEPRNLKVDAWVASTPALLALLVRWSTTLKKDGPTRAFNTLAAFLSCCTENDMLIPVKPAVPAAMPADSLPLPLEEDDIMIRVTNGAVHGEELFNKTPDLRVLESRTVQWAVNNWRFIFSDCLR